MKAIRSALGVGIALFGTLANAQSPPPKQIELDIKRQSLADALTDWAQQTGLQLIVSDELTGRIVAPRVKGNYTAQAALNQLLAGTTLTYTFVDPRTVAIREQAPPGQPISSRQEGFLTEIDAELQAVLSLGDDVDPEMLLAALEAVTVTGSRLRVGPDDIRANGEANTAAPVTVFNRERIEQLGASNVSDLLSFLPQQPYKRSEATRVAQHVEMRGLGVDTTLVLVNGRRVVPSASSVSNNAFDVNTLPISAVDRMEVLSDSASAVYGADAVGGVVNFILKKDITRPVLDLSFGTADGGAEERRFSLNSGYSTERFRGSLILDYFDRDFLLGEERDRYRNQDFRRFGSRDWRSTITNPANITSRTAANLPGLSSRFTAVPAGSTGIGMTPADFAATAGQQNVDSVYRYWSIVPEVSRRNAAAFAEFDITSKVALFSEFFYADKRSVFQTEPASLSNVRVPAANFYNPFDVDVSVNYLFTGIGPRQSVTESELYRGLLGLRGEIGTWDWDLSFLKSNEDAENWTENNIDMARVNIALAEANDPARALNVFQDGPGGSSSLLASLLSKPVNEYFSKGMQSAGILRGPLFNLPAGAAEVVIGGEWLKEEMFLDDATFVVKHDRSIAAAFTELRLPLVSSAMQIPAVAGLSLTLAARYDDYSDFGSTFNPQYGLVWTPIPDLLLRASYSTSFRAPSLFELFAPQTTVPGLPIPDPMRNNEFANVTFVTGGNPDLDPGEADSFTTGFVFNPSALKGMQLSSSYWRIEMDKRVKGLSYLNILSNPDLFPGRVIRAERTNDDIARGLPGVLTFLDISRVNFGSVETSGIDFSAAYAFDTPIGQFIPSISGTWIEKYDEVVLPGTPAVDRVGIADVQGTIVRWRGVASVAWKRNGLRLSATARYTPEYQGTLGSWPGSTGPVQSVTLPSQTLVDAQASVDFDEMLGSSSSWRPGLKLTLGIQNLFDEEPNFAEVGGAAGHDMTQGEYRLRFGYIKLSTSF